ncbi:hypothetical protein SNOG_01670 [Parastagonospora nodorum SN15]|uniref:Uncharacterized protein n=1 Tax=Phaeosphaeria nodorum (strain SN15 / ATCC MYA-4574 / FGSC 10173) TaxID=321614 RepID=Q0V2U4_PHANO|nr:hypothetical protein SNOG_01670 [Parastagonospora nodorum SN15]EAT91319.1 hypothetical protein SNOG_01670 [Parastagonospora nodorum SN15]
MSAMVEVERPTELQVLIDTQLGRMFRNSQRIPRESGTFRGISTAYEMCCMEVPETTN